MLENVELQTVVSHLNHIKYTVVLMTKYYLSHYHLFSLNQLSLDASLNWLVSVVPNILRLESLELYVVLLIVD